ncbi:DUF1573 domain-containing protein [Neolewinella persica]|uniref:DUF1573 domain-containing protein n=1 Tax=Neolewinella persica TaxID=70998 RepID=UPI00036A589C|nr:DUF1573 domain-containing protein [Neolewinella persica]
MKLIFQVLLPAFLLSLLLSCESGPASAPDNGTDVSELGPNAALIRNPVDAGVDNIDTVNVAKLSFAEANKFTFGSVKEGEVVNHDFTFTNTGKVPLLITKARSTCGCTVPAYPEQPVAPGEGGVISVAFDTKNKYGQQTKAVTITANTYPASTVVYIDGTVIKEK